MISNRQRMPLTSCLSASASIHDTLFKPTRVRVITKSHPSEEFGAADPSAIVARPRHSKIGLTRLGSIRDMFPAVSRATTGRRARFQAIPLVFDYGYPSEKI